MKKIITLESRYGNLPDVRVKATVINGTYFVPLRVINRINRNGAGDYYPAERVDMDTCIVTPAQ